MEARSRILGAEHPDNLASMGHLASAYEKQERWEVVEKLQFQVMKISSWVLGVEHPNTLASIGNFVAMCQDQKEAEKLHFQIMEMMK
jgi:hypothetical protein